MAEMHEIEYKIFGDDMQFVEVELDPNEALGRLRHSVRRQNQIRPVRWRRVVFCHAERTRTCLAAIPSTQPAGEPDHRRRARADAGRPRGRLDPWRVGESPRRR